MKYIPLTQGQVALVDDDDYEYLSQWKWCACKRKHTWYACHNQYNSAARKQVTFFMHRLLLGLNPGDSRQGDHIDFNGLKFSRGEREQRLMAPAKKTGRSLHQAWSGYLRDNGMDMSDWEDLSVLTKRAWNSLVDEKKPDEEVITDADLLPRGWITRRLTANGGYESSWRRQYHSFSTETRNAGAKRLYDALTPAQRAELKKTGSVSFKCAKGHEFKATPEYAGTTDVGCVSVGGDHKPTTIGDFLLAIKIRFAADCLCRKFY